MNMKKSLGVTGIAAALAMASPAHADHTEELAAQTLYDKALELMKAGKPSSACPLLAESQRLDPAVGTQYWLAECFEKTGRTEAAWRLYTEVAEASKKAGRKDREAQAHERAEIVRKLLARLTITISPDLARIEGLAVMRDGKAVLREEWNLEALVEPGKHTVEVRAPARKAWQGTTMTSEGAAGEVRVPLLEDVALAEAPVPDVALPVEPPLGGSNKIVVITGTAAGIVALGMGVGFAVAGAAKARQFETSALSECTDGKHDGQYWGCSDKLLAIDSSRVTFANVAGYSFIAAGLIGAGTLTYALLGGSSKSKSRPTATVVVLPGVVAGTASISW